MIAARRPVQCPGVVLVLVASVAVSIGCQRADSKVTETRARAAASERAERASRYALEDRTFEGTQPGGPGIASPPVAPVATLPELIEDIRGEVGAILEDHADPRALGARIRDALMAESSIADGIHELEVDTAGSRVILRGWVRTTADRIEAGERARAIAGADFVDNQLTVRGY
jgi:hypothetical protein